MTWIEMANRINTWSSEQQGQDVTVYLQGSDEFFSAVPMGPDGEQDVSLALTAEDAPDVLDTDSYYLSVAG